MAVHVTRSVQTEKLEQLSTTISDQLFRRDMSACVACLLEFRNTFDSRISPNITVIINLVSKIHVVIEKLPLH